MTNTGAMCAYSGTKYGRSPKEKRIVNDNITKDKIWWKDNNAISDNQKITPEVNKVCKDLAIKYLNTKHIRNFLTSFLLSLVFNAFFSFFFFSCQCFFYFEKKKIFRSKDNSYNAKEKKIIYLFTYLLISIIKLN